MATQSISQPFPSGRAHTRSKILGAALALAVVAALAMVGVWYFILKSDAPPPVSLQAALESAATSEALASTTNTAASTTNDSGSSNSASGALAGTWTVVQGANSFVGYRVNENLAGIGATTAVGRSQAIDGQLSFDGTAITAVQITADLSQLQSDKDMRDNTLRMQALQTATYPTATFVLTSPIEISQLPADGQTLSETATGKLTLHGITRDVVLQVQGALQGTQVVVVGTTDIQFSDYGISSPRAAAVLSIDDDGTMEFQLVFAKAV